MTIPKKLSLQFASDINLLEERHLEHLRRFIFDTVRRSPDCGEGVIEVDGIQHCFTYVVKGDVIDARVLPRDTADAILNYHGLGTIEPWIAETASAAAPEIDESVAHDGGQVNDNQHVRADEALSVLIEFAKFIADTTVITVAAEDVNEFKVLADRVRSVINQSG